MTTITRAPLWAQLLMLIPTCVCIGVVVLLLVYKPENYETIVGAFIFSFFLVVIFGVWAKRKARVRKQNNG